MARAVNEIRVTNTLLKAIDGKSERTFAYPCGDLMIGDTVFYNLLKNDFIAARGVVPGYPQIKDIDLSNVNAFSQNNSTVAQMKFQVEEAEKPGH
ncbi:polysaccharide deacetylase family protein [Arcticibacter svalbardensis MN12-7]|uniref:Polysaccharide deacetylase family protein n=1 Tax=Arcticibacter svalbardensis MN12-7 TaxID=1150600 RepID=R9GR52_9SPHI|nr:polysaccharide deacetylase family protein [Arcticibacter svalbardensis MN12-7]